MSNEIKAKEKIILCDNTIITLNYNVTTCGAPVHSLEYGMNLWI